MAYFAKVDENNKVTDVIAVANDVIGEPDLQFPDTEQQGQGFIKWSLRLDGKWLQTSFHDSFRQRYAGIGYYYDSQRDEFVPPGWELVDGEWTAPVIDIPAPTD
jgi:hypothetical protein